MLEDSVRLAQLLVTRFCHDLAGPVGAVNNGIEFLGEEAGDIKEDALALAASSAAEALHRLQFYRSVYGVIKHSGEASTEELQRLAVEGLQTERLTFDWSGWPADLAISRQKGQLLFHLLILASQSLLKGGTVGISIERPSQLLRISVEATGDMVRFNPNIARAANERLSIDEVTPETIQAHLFYTLYTHWGVRYQALEAEGHLCLRLESEEASATIGS